jgi:hypothetical protein
VVYPLAAAGHIASSLKVCEEPGDLWTRFTDLKKLVSHNFRGRLGIGVGVWTKAREDEDELVDHRYGKSCGQWSII